VHRSDPVTNGSKFGPPIDVCVAIAAEATLVLLAGELLMILWLNPPAKHCSIITIRQPKLGSSPTLAARSSG